MELFAKSNPAYQTLRKEIEDAGGSVDRVRMGRHIIVYWSVGSKTFVTPVSCTSRSNSGLLNLRGEIRRKIRAATVTPTNGDFK